MDPVTGRLEAGDIIYYEGGPHIVDYVNQSRAFVLPHPWTGTNRDANGKNIAPNSDVRVITDTRRRVPDREGVTDTMAKTTTTTTTETAATTTSTSKKANAKAAALPTPKKAAKPEPGETNEAPAQSKSGSKAGGGAGGSAPAPKAAAKRSKKAARRADLDSKLVKSKGEEKARTLTPCRCGCGAEVPRYFAQGHDAKFKGWMKKIERGQMKPTDVPDSVRKLVKFRKLDDGSGYIPTFDYTGEPIKA